ncbi:MAG: sulfatase-like hydrolase/transferase [Mycobacteriales bacterium]
MAGTTRNLIIVTLDSLRYDAWTAANPSVLGKIGPVQRRYSYASWTAPSHYNLMMGLLPHDSPKGIVASEHYKKEFRQYQDRLGTPDIDFAKMLPHLWLPRFLHDKLGYATGAYVSMPVLNQRTPLNSGFDEYELMTPHNDMRQIVQKLRFDDDQPRFYLLNVGETHYPYAVPGEDVSHLPHVSGLHGTLRRAGSDDEESIPFTPELLRELRERQIAAVSYLDGVFAELFNVVPDNTWLIVTSDHGELFGEDNYFGHGPIVHEKVLEVPFVEGVVPR